jgi:hypothetical protein
MEGYPVAAGRYGNRVGLVPEPFPAIELGIIRAGDRGRPPNPVLTAAVEVASNLGGGALSPGEQHDQFLQLCAVSTSGQLAHAEQERLQWMHARPKILKFSFPSMSARNDVIGLKRRGVKR